MRLLALIVVLNVATSAYCMEAADEESLRGIGGNYRCATEDETNLKIDGPLNEVSVPQEAIRKVFQSNGGRLNAIYMRELRSNECLSGALLLRIRLDDGGKVIDIDYRASNRDISKIGNDVINTVREFRFPSSFDGKTQEFWYTINFIGG